jgi:tetratricopeptide (TPR) repeat protein
MAQMASSMSTRDGRLTNYGMGWDTGPQAGRFMLIHSGGQQETLTLLYVVPRQQLAFAIGMNFEAGNPGVYLDRLFQLVTGTPRNLGMYTADKSKAPLLDAINSTFNYGLASYEQHRSSMAKNKQELAEAFAYFNANVNSEALTANAQESSRKIREGVHPAGNQAFTKVGSFMAEQLAKKRGAVQLISYPAEGGLAFFNDYVMLTKADSSLPTFTESFAKSISPIASDWTATNSPYVRALWLMPNSDLKHVGAMLRKTFANRSVYPNLVDPLFSLTRQAILNRNLPGAREAGKLAFDLYPESPTSNFAYGISLVLSGDTTQAQTLLKKAAALNPNGAASAGGLNSVAYQLGNTGMVDEAIKILNTAIALYPKEANLHDSFGEMQLRKGNKTAALDSYKKALELNPNFPNANAAKEIVRKLSEEIAGRQK